jgi:energy-converting hydrogenase Eha subunit E
MNKKTLASDRRRRKTITLLWVLGVSLLVIFLIYKEMTAILYILATIGVTVLLLLVAFSDLAHDGSSEQTALSNDAASTGNKLS